MLHTLCGDHGDERQVASDGAFLAYHQFCLSGHGRSLTKHLWITLDNTCYLRCENSVAMLRTGQ